MAAGVLLIIYTPARDPRLIAFGLFIAFCGALTWGVLKIIAYFKVAATCGSAFGARASTSGSGASLAGCDAVGYDSGACGGGQRPF
jgi:hypothetical protein